jgi:hypothetical protein
MMQVDEKLTRQQLEKMNRLHRLELRQIKNMTEEQFQVFKRNFSFGHLENITKVEAYELLTSMLALNLNLLEDVKLEEQKKQYSNNKKTDVRNSQRTG